DAFDERAVLLEIVALEARVALARVALGEVREIGNDAGEQAPAERRVGDERNAEVAGCLACLLRLLAIEQRVFALHGGDRVHRIGAADALGVRLAKAEMAHLALLDEAAHRADRVLERPTGIDAVRGIEVYRVNAESGEARLASLLDVGRTTVDAIGAPGTAGLAEFRRDDDLVAHRFEGAAEQFLVVPPTIHVGAVEMVDAELDGAPQERLCRLV